MIEIIAEIGKNFIITQAEEPTDVLVSRAKTLILEAKRSGADTVKFQVHHVDDEIHPDNKIISPHFDQERYEWVKRNTFQADFWMKIIDFCREVDIEFLATPMSRGAAILLDIIGVDRWKIGSGDILDFVMLDYIRDTGKPVILSSGMSSLEELKLAYDFLKEKTNDISILHCVSQYPCPLASLNLLSIPFLKKQFPDVRIGFSDHSLEISTGAFAIELGAEIIEKHFTLDRKAWGPDHKVSLQPEEFSQMVKEIKIKQDSKIPIMIPPIALGVATKYIQKEEEKFRLVFRKGLYTARDIKQGEIFEPQMFYAIRPINGALPSQFYESVVKMKALKDYKRYEKIS